MPLSSTSRHNNMLIEKEVDDREKPLTDKIELSNGWQ
jgi:hypothetical protein